MKPPIKLVIDQHSIRKDRTCIVYIQYCHSSTRRVLLNSGIEIPPENWNIKNQQVTGKPPEKYGDSQELNLRLRKMVRVVEDLVEMAANQTQFKPIEFVKKYFKVDLDAAAIIQIGLKVQAKNNNKNLDIYYQIDDYIASKVNKVCADMPRIYRNMKDHLKEFEKFSKRPITFDRLDLDFYEKFVDFLSHDYIVKRRTDDARGLKTNTVGKTIKQFRTFLRNRIRKRIIPPIDMDGWDILEVEVDAVYLTRDEIQRIGSLDLSARPDLVNNRNDLVIGCLTGLRFSDFSNISVTDIRGEFLYKKQQKSNRWVVIPLRAGAKKLLQDKFEKGVAVPTNGIFNREIKIIAGLAGINETIKHSYRKGNREIVEIKPKYKWITSHTCRRSFCTNEFLAGTPVELIMKISGHKSVKDFYKYIRISPEEAAVKIMEIWGKRGETFASSPYSALNAFACHCMQYSLPNKSKSGLG